MPQYSAFFISPYGDIIQLSSDRHIEEIWQNPKKFGLTLDEIEKIFKKHDERRGSEGKAREEIIRILIQKGWARIRYVRPTDSYMIQINSLDNRQKENIYDWAKLVGKGNKGKDKYIGVSIMEIKPGGDTKRGTIEDILKYQLFEEMVRTRPQSKAVIFIEKYIAKNT